MKVKDFLTKDQQARVIEAIQNAELNTSGEIRVHLESKCKTDVLDRAVYIFNYLKMHKTAQRNGVLIYVAVENKRFAIIGDCGINSKVPSYFWDSIKQKMGESFKQGLFCEGLCTAVIEAGKQLKTYFPYQNDDINEQPDEISFGE